MGFCCAPDQHIGEGTSLLFANAIVEWANHSNSFCRLGATIPRGILEHPPPSVVPCLGPFHNYDSPSVRLMAPRPPGSLVEFHLLIRKLIIIFC